MKSRFNPFLFMVALTGLSLQIALVVAGFTIAIVVGSRILQELVVEFGQIG